MRIRIASSELTAWRWIERGSIVILVLSCLLIIARIILMPVGELASRAAIPAVQPAKPPQTASVTTSLPTPSSPSLTAASVPTVAAEPARGAAERTATRATHPDEPPTRAAAHEPNQPVRVRGKSGLVVAATKEEDAAELLRRPESLTAIIQTGSLFGVPNDTAVAIGETHAGLVRVHVLDGKFAGREGWVPIATLVRK